MFKIVRRIMALEQISGLESQRHFQSTIAISHLKPYITNLKFVSKKIIRLIIHLLTSKKEMLYVYGQEQAMKLAPKLLEACILNLKFHHHFQVMLIISLVTMNMVYLIIKNEEHFH